VTVFGLGNPGRRYAHTRHNVGFLVADLLVHRLGCRYRIFPDRASARRRWDSNDLVMVKPLLYMNESGRVVQREMERRPDDLLVVCDDLALPFGRLRLRTKGSDGGHKGLASIIAHLGHSSFARLRIGIDAPAAGSDAVAYVLAPFPQEQAALLPEVIGRAADACLAAVTEGLARAMNRFNPEPVASL